MDIAAVARPRAALVARVAILASSEIVTAATLLAALVLRGRRAFMLVDFPLNDGGMFSTAISDIRAAGYALPAVLTYNGGIPFAYMRLGLELFPAFAVLAVAGRAPLVDRAYASTALVLGGAFMAFFASALFFFA